MIKLIPIILISIVAAFFSDVFSVQNPIKSSYYHKSKLLWIIIPLTIAIFTGLRTNYNDTRTYLESYIYLTNSEFDFSTIDIFSVGDSPLFYGSMIFFKSLGFSTNGFLMVYALFTYFVYIWFIRKYSTDFTMSIIIFICLVMTFPMAAIKQTTAMAICLIAVDCMLRHKWAPFVIFIVIAELFHAYSFMYLITPLLIFVPWSDKRTIRMVILFLLAGVMLRPFLGTIISITDMLGEEYTVEEFSGLGVNPFRVVVCLIPLILSYVLRKKILDPENEVSAKEGLFMNFSFLNGEIMFIALFGTANYFGRLANYFSIFPVIAIPRMLNMLDRKWQLVVKVVLIFGYFFFLWYSCNYSGFKSFDREFLSIPIGEFTWMAVE